MNIAKQDILNIHIASSSGAIQLQMDGSEKVTGLVLCLNVRKASQVNQHIQMLSTSAQKSNALNNVICKKVTPPELQKRHCM